MLKMKSVPKLSREVVHVLISQSRLINFETNLSGKPYSTSQGSGSRLRLLTSSYSSARDLITSTVPRRIHDLSSRSFN